MWRFTCGISTIYLCNTCVHTYIRSRAQTPMKILIKRMWLGVDMLNLLLDFTSQNWLMIAKHFDNRAVVFISGSTKQRVTHFIWDEDNRMVVETFGNYQSVLASEVRYNRFNEAPWCVCVYIHAWMWWVIWLTCSKCTSNSSLPYLHAQAPTVPGVYEARYYPAWLSGTQNGFKNDKYWGKARFTVKS